MPSPRHDALNALVRNHPDLPIRLLREIGGINLPDAPLSIGPGDLNDRISRELHADTIVIAGPAHDRFFSVMVEIETKMTEAKLRQTAIAATILWLSTRKPVHVVFITPDPEAARYAGPIAQTHGSVTLTMHPVIVGPGVIPVLTDPQAMAGDLLMASLSVMAHGDRPEVAEAFVKLLNDLPDDDATSLFAYTIDMAAPQARRLLEETVTVYIPQLSPWARNLYHKGEAAGEASCVLEVLHFRGIEVPPERERQIRTCTDLDQLKLWLRRALDATHIDDLFDDVPEAGLQP